MPENISSHGRRWAKTITCTTIVWTDLHQTMHDHELFTCHSALATIGQARLLAVGLLHSNWCRDVCVRWVQHLTQGNKVTRIMGRLAHTTMLGFASACKHSASLSLKKIGLSPSQHMPRMAMFWTCKDGSLTAQSAAIPLSEVALSIFWEPVEPKSLCHHCLASLEFTCPEHKQIPSPFVL